MGLFDKKFCSICGEKIGLLGNRKLEDGNLCKNCARKLSPFFSERRSSTTEQIKAQLAYREQNKLSLNSFAPNISFGENTKLFADTVNRKFIVTDSSNWRNENPDLLDFSQVISCETDVTEHKEEIYRQDKDGNSVSYSPPRYETEYEFAVTLNVDTPWFTQIEFELSDGERPDSRFSELFRKYDAELQKLKDMFAEKAAFPGTNTAESAPAQKEWVCEYCLNRNQTDLCTGCGMPRPQGQRTFTCPKCGHTQPCEKAPAFCPHCGESTRV